MIFKHKIFCNDQIDQKTKFWSNFCRSTKWDQMVLKCALSIFWAADGNNKIGRSKGLWTKLALSYLLHVHFFLIFYSWNLYCLNLCNCLVSIFYAIVICEWLIIFNMLLTITFHICFNMRCSLFTCFLLNHINKYLFFIFLIMIAYFSCSIIYCLHTYWLFAILLLH